MSTGKQNTTAEFRVTDAMAGPHRGQILRVRLTGGRTPTLKELKGARLKARSPDGTESEVRVTGFSIIGGKPSDSRFNRTGRLDLVVERENGYPPVELRWVLSGPA